MQQSRFRPKLVLWASEAGVRHYLPTVALSSIFWLVTSVTGSSNRAQPISEIQLQKIRSLARYHAVDVEVLPCFDWDRIVDLYMMGYCELSPIQEYVLRSA